ncbi:heterokaryon incompatibility protein [Colletotrichum truncatum]|uniref:Heterokaryon incompatibility protein n=1 Tax=Colletotrichum truncatum TaxID=5467 RepID=A0ACC3ZFT8_COLTU|nr:heterokaryon incompatibility protein [Colletotrichum truncatum]KAF6801897.1 heterokaryon incompatibility protein [Colletotrichum truncatum]
MAFTYQPLQNTRRDIRLLEIDFHDAAADRIKCSIIHDTLDDDPQFTALSYVWGDAAQPRSILLEGQEVSVTQNLFRALQRLAKFSKPQVSKLWIDALCINQADDEEKAHQVQLMGRIYSSASQVLIWLGPEDDASVDALHQLSLLGSTFEDLKARPDYGPVVCQAFVKTVLEFSGTSLNFAHIQTLFRRPWWTRVWVIQEALLAKQAYVLIGDHAKDWKEIRGAWSAFEWMILYVNTDPKYRPVYEILNEVYFKIAHFTQGETAEDGTRKLASLFDTVFFSAAGGAIQSTDPRDRIYGLFGLLTERDKAKIPVDYSCHMTLERLLFFTTKALIEDHGPDILCYRRPTLLSVGGPSWTVDWTSKMIATIGGFNHGSNNYDASKGTVWSPKTFDATFEDPAIRLWGVVVGHVKDVGGVLESTVDSPSYIDDCRSWLLELENLVYSNSKDDPERLEIIQNLWRVPIADMGLVERAKPEDGYPQAYEVLTGVTKPPHGDDESGWVTSSSWPYRRVWKVYGHRACIFESANGRAPGLGPSGMCPGDMVVIFSGSHVPFVVRESSQGYSLIGSAYAYGYMDGNAFETITSARGLKEFQLH